jgi:Calx-beta domain
MPPRKIGLILVLSLAASVLWLIPTGAAACASNHIRFSLTAFPAEGSTRAVYFIPEPSSPAQFTIVASGDACSETAYVHYAATGGTADSGDYQLTPKTESFFLPPHETATKSVSVTITNDSDPEAHVESIQIGLSNPQNAVLGIPSTAPILIIDDEAPTRAGFEGTEHTQSESNSTLRLPVFLAGPAPGTVSFSIAPDPAAPATPGEDFQGPTTGSLTLSPTDRVETIDLSIVNDTVGEPPESFVVSLTGPIAPGAGQMKVTISDNEEGEAPSSRIHHPRHKWRYKKSDYRIREVHIFTQDTGGSGVAGAQFALRRNMKNGNCRWLTMNGWREKDCQSREWLPTTYDNVGELWRIRLKQLKSSVGTNIKNYTAFSRAIDGANNVENDFAEKRNDNTFEVKRSRNRGR